MLWCRVAVGSIFNGSDLQHKWIPNEAVLMKMTPFNEWLQAHDRELHNEIFGIGKWAKKITMPLMAAGAMAAGGVAQAPDVAPITPHRQMMQQHQQFMQKHQQFMQGVHGEMDRVGKDVDGLGSKNDQAEDAAFYQDLLDSGMDKGLADRMLNRRQQSRHIMGTPSQQAAEKAQMANAEMDLDANDPNSWGHEGAKKGDYEAWRRGKEVEDIHNIVNTDDTVKKLLNKRR